MRERERIFSLNMIFISFFSFPFSSSSFFLWRLVYDRFLLQRDGIHREFNNIQEHYANVSYPEDLQIIFRDSTILNAKLRANHAMHFVPEDERSLFWYSSIQYYHHFPDTYYRIDMVFHRNPLTKNQLVSDILWNKRRSRLPEIYSSCVLCSLSLNHR